MPAPVISVRGVGKEYRLGEFNRPNTLRDTISGLFRKPQTGQQSTTNARDQRFWALKDISFELAEGEVLGIIGANGAGKSTLLKILSRITEPTTGEIELRGRVASLLEVGTGFNDELTGRENIILNGAILGMAKREIDRKLAEIIDFSGVEKFLDTPVKRYSSGMKMRLAFSVAAHLEPEILIVDEVLAVGDAQFQTKCLGKMDDVARSGRTVLFVSHNLPAVENLCRRCILLTDGHVEADGDTNSIIGRYLKGELLEGSSCADLREHSGRTRNTLQRLMNSLTFRNGDLSPSQTYSIGDDIVVDVAFEGLDAPTSVVLGVVIRTESDQAVMTVDNRFIPGFELEKVTQGIIRCVVPKVALTPGRYWVDLYLGNRSQSLDAVLQAAMFEIVETDYYGSGRLPPLHDRGFVLGTARWQLVQEA